MGQYVENQATQTAQNVPTTPTSYPTSTTAKTYRIILEQDEDGRIVAKCLDLQGVVTDGETENEAIKNVCEAIEAMLEARSLDKDFNLIIV